MYSKKAFTLIEMIVVITILAILGVIGFISVDGYFASARDGSRLEDMHKIYSELGTSFTSKGTFPLPDNYATINSSGSTIAYQGYAGANILKTIKFEKGGKDPTDNVYYTYTINSKRSQSQLMGYFEDYDVTKISKTNIILPEAHAASTVDYTERKIGVIGKLVGTLIDSATLAPLQQSNSGGSMDITNSSGYTVYFSNVKSSTETNLQSEYQDNSAIYTSIAPENGICGSANNSFISSAPSSNLCSKGTPTTVTGIGPWDWTCTGVGTGTTASCSATTYAGVFATGSEYISNWVNNTCNPTGITIDTTTFSGGTQYISSMNLAGNKVYIVPNGTYILTGALGVNGHLNFSAACIALMGESRDGVIFSGGLTSGGYISSTPVINAWQNGVILSNFTIRSGSGATNEYGKGLVLVGDNTSVKNLKVTNVRELGIDAVVSNSTITGITLDTVKNGATIAGSNPNVTVTNLSVTNSWNNGVTFVKVNASNISAIMNPIHSLWAYNVAISGTGGVYKNFVAEGGRDSLFLYDWADNNTFENFSVRNGGRGIHMRGAKNSFKNIEVYDTDEWGVFFESSNANYNAFNNLRVYNGTGTNDGIYFEQGSRNTFSNVLSFNNNRDAFRINTLFAPPAQTVLHNALLSNAGTNWIGISNLGSGTIFSDITINNTTYGYDNGGNKFGTGSKFYGQFKVLGAMNPFVPGASLSNTYFATGSSGDFASASLTSGVFSTGAIGDCTLHPQPNIVASWGTNCSATGALSTTTSPVSSWNFGTNIANQTRPLRWNPTTGILERYGTDGVDYDSTKKIGEW